jgi:hypothetical protein
MTLFKHTASGLSGSAPWSFTLHTTGNTDYITAAGYWATAITAGWAGSSVIEDVYPSTVVLNSVSTASINEATDKQISRQIDAVSHAGSITGNVLPFQVAVVVSLQSTLATRSGRGRFYLPPPDVSMVTAGKLSATCVTNLAAGLVLLFASLNSNNLTPVIRNRTSHASTTITSGRLGNVFDTQRRRRDSVVEVYTAVAIPCSLMAAIS